MLDLTPQYAPDLEWMLQSGQVPRELLLEALLQEYYAPVYHLALSILDDHAAAGSAAGQTFATALLDQHRYRSADGVDFWLFRIAVDVCQGFQKRLQFRRSLKATLPRWSKLGDLGDSCPETLQDAQLWLALDSLEQPNREIALLYFANDWQPERIAALVEVAQDEIAQVLGAVRRLVATSPQLDTSSSAAPDAPSLDAALPFESSLPPEQIDIYLFQSLGRRWPAREFSPAELQTRAGLILRRLRWLGFRQTKVLAAVELGLLVVVILLAFVAIWGVNLLAGEQPTITPTALAVTYLATKVIYQVVTPTTYPEASIEPTATPIPVAGGSYTQVRPGETLPDVAKRMGVTVADLRYWNRLPDYVEVQAGERLINPQYARSLQPSVATPVAPVEPQPAIAASVTTTRQLIDLLNRRNQRLNNYWFDVSIIDYGPQSYIGPARLTHLQLWESESQSLLLIGPYGAFPDEAILWPFGNDRFLARPGADPPWFSEWRAMNSEEFNSPALQPYRLFAPALFNSNVLQEGSSFQLAGRESLAGRSTLQIDLFDSQGGRLARLWVDESLGQILRRIDYRAGDIPATEYRINSLEVNVDFPQYLFDLRLPWRGWFAQDYRGAPLAPNAPAPDVPSRDTRLSGPPAPAELDLSRSILTFQYPPSYASPSAEAQIELFAGNYSLGPAIFGDPWGLICNRSPDGRWIAFVSQPVREDRIHSTLNVLNWIDLKDPSSQFHNMYYQLGIKELAFSPDSRRLAFFSHPYPSIPGILSILNISTRQVTHIFSTGDLKSLVWSPDGKYLAFINHSNPAAYLKNALVISSADGSVSYNAALDVQNEPVKDWPMAAWGVSFPVEMGGMDACAKPPLPVIR